MIRTISRSVALLLFTFIVLACVPLSAPSSESGSVTRPEGSDGADDVTTDEVDLVGEGHEEDTVSEPIVADVVTKAVSDLAGRLSVSADAIDVLEVRPVTWPDASLGCAEPGMVYAQVAQDGLLIRLDAGGEMYFYHSGADQKPFLCEETAQVVPKVTPKTDEFVPPPGSETD